MSYPGLNMLMNRQTINRAAGWSWEDDFTSYADTTAFDAAYPTTNTATLRGDPTNDEIDIDFDWAGTNDTLYYDTNSDIGSNISDTAFLFRFPMNTTTLGQTQNGAAAVGLSDNTSDHVTSQDGIFLSCRVDSGGSFYEMADPDAETIDSGQQVDMATSISEVLRYTQVVRNSSTSSNISFSTTSSYTKDTEDKAFTIGSTTGGLRYFKATVNGSSSDARLVFEIKTLQLNDGVTTPP